MFLNCDSIELFKLPCLDIDLISDGIFVLDDVLNCIDILNCCLEDRNDDTSDILLEGLGILNGNGILE